jgi:hypothetical protein
MDLYVFVIGVRAWDKDLLSTVHGNFDRLAKNLGPRAALIRGHDGVDLVPELYKVIGANHTLEKLAYSGERGQGGILLLGAHPAEFSDEDLVLYAPLAELESRFSGIHNFFNDICDFVATRDPAFLRKFKESSAIAKGVLDIVELKPSFFGIGLNINAAIRKLLGQKGGSV